jgi:hypothetical protein
VRLGFGLTKKSSRKPILGYTDRATVKLDFDGEQFKKVRYWGDRAMKHFRLGGYIILRSSRDHYHVVFNKTVNWEENCRVMAWAALLSRNSGLRKWTLMQQIKRASTLRISSKGEKLSPRIVCREGMQDKEIHSFELWRRRIKCVDRSSIRDF